MISAKTCYGIPTCLRMRNTGDLYVLTIMDMRGNSGTFSNAVLSLMAFYMRADVDGEYIAPIS